MYIINAKFCAGERTIVVKHIRCECLVMTTSRQVYSLIVLSEFNALQDKDTNIVYLCLDAAPWRS